MYNSVTLKPGPVAQLGARFNRTEEVEGSNPSRSIIEGLVANMRKQNRKYGYGLREQARKLRQSGLSYSEICETLGVEIPKSTLSNWVTDVLLTPEQHQRIAQKEREGAIRGRKGGLWGGAAGWNREQKRRRLEVVRYRAELIAEQLVENNEALMLMASALYMGEGAKGEKYFSIGNSDPKIIQVWLAVLRRTFEIDENKFRCQLALTEGMNEEALKRYWAEVTCIPLHQFMKTSFRKNSGGRKREGYKGVCIVYYHSMEVRRLLEAIGEGVVNRLVMQEDE